MTITISDGLWLEVWDGDPEYDDGIITIRDDTGHTTYIDRAEIPALIEALEKLKAEQEVILG